MNPIRLFVKFYEKTCINVYITGGLIGVPIGINNYLKDRDENKLICDKNSSNFGKSFEFTISMIMSIVPCAMIGVAYPVTIPYGIYYYSKNKIDNKIEK